MAAAPAASAPLRNDLRGMDMMADLIPKPVMLVIANPGFVVGEKLGNKADRKLRSRHPSQPASLLFL
jgi:hypothetical protein